MEIKELKARAYDILAQIDFLQGELRKVNQAIAEESQKPKEVNQETKEENSPNFNAGRDIHIKE